MYFKKILLLTTCYFLTACTTTGSSPSRSSKAAMTGNTPEENPIVFSFPLSQYKRVSRGYNGKHKGVDVSAPKGTPIYAAESGWVIYQGRRFKGYGKLVIVEHSQKWATFYAHMTKFELSEGAWVNKGDIIGYVGNTGRSTAPHLHFEIRFNNTAIDPMPYFNSAKLKFAVSNDGDDGTNHSEE